MMNLTHKDDATRRLGRALVYIISLANEDQAADAERDSEAPSASATGGTLDDEEPQERSRRVENGDGKRGFDYEVTIGKDASAL